MKACIGRKKRNQDKRYMCFEQRSSWVAESTRWRCYQRNMIWIESWLNCCSLYLTLFTFFGFFSFQNPDCPADCVCAFSFLCALPKQWEPAKEWCLPVPKLSPLCSFFRWRRHKWRPRLSIEALLIRGLSWGDVLLVTVAWRSVVFCFLQSPCFELQSYAFNGRIQFSKSNLRGQTISCGNGISWANATKWQQFRSVFPGQVSPPSCCFPSVALWWLLPVSDGMNAKRIFPCWFLQQWEELRRCNDFSPFPLSSSGWGPKGIGA